MEDKGAAVESTLEGDETCPGSTDSDVTCVTQTRHPGFYLFIRLTEMKQSEMSDSDCANGFCWATATPFGQTTPRIAEAVHDNRRRMTINYIHFLSLIMIRMKFANDCSLISMYLGFGTITTLVYEFDQPEEEFRRMIQLFLNKISLHFIVLYVI